MRKYHDVKLDTDEQVEEVMDDEVEVEFYEEIPEQVEEVLEEEEEIFEEE